MDGEGLMQQLPSSISREATCFWLDFWLSQANAMDQCNRGMRLAQSSCWPGEIQFQVPVLAEFLFGPQQGSVSPSEASREENGHFWLLGHSAWQPLSPLISHVKGASALTPREVGFPWNSVTLEQCGKRKMNAGL